MEEQSLLKFSAYYFKNTTITNFSNMPYSVFKTSLMPDTYVSKIKQKIKKLKWRSNVVTLRAPKHFKVGRQHYNKSSRYFYIYLTTRKPKWAYCLNSKNIYWVNHVLNLNSKINLNTPLSTTKNYKLNYSFKFQFSEIQ